MVQNLVENVEQDAQAMRLQSSRAGLRVAKVVVGVALVGAVLFWGGRAWAAGVGHSTSEFQPNHGSAQGYLGVMVADVGEEQTALRLKDGRGAVITHVDHDGPAGKMGLRLRDVVLQINGVQLEGAEQMRRMLHDLAPGKAVVMVVTRDGQAMTMSAQMADRDEVDRRAWREHVTDPQAPATGLPTGEMTIPEPSPAGPAVNGGKYGHSFLGSLLPNPSYTGLMLEKIGPQLAGFFGVQAGPGMLVKSVEVNSPAMMAGIRAGDVIVRANSHGVGSASEWVKLVKESKGGPVTVVVVRDRTERTLTLTPDTKRRSSVELPGMTPGGVSFVARDTPL